MLDGWLLLPALALVAGVVALTPLGSQVLQRGVVFIDLAVAQAAGAAVIWVSVVMHLDSGLWDQVAATVGAVLASLGVAAVSRRWPQQREALIGLVYVTSACLALLGASVHPLGKDKLLALLAADVLWVEGPSVIALAFGAVVMGVVQSRAWMARAWVFYAVFAGVCSLAVPALGLFLVFAALIAPALWIERGVAQWAAVAAASAVALAGLLASSIFDTPSGPTVAAALAVFGMASLTVRPSASR